MTRKGSGYTLEGAEEVDIDKIIQLFDTPTFVGVGVSGVVFSTHDALPQMCNPTTKCPAKFICKFIHIDEDDEDINIEKFKRECDIQRDIYVKLLDKFNCSFVPMILHSHIYEDDVFREKFSAISEHKKFNDNLRDTRNKFGVIIMESFGDVRPMRETDSKYFPLALREMHMLAQIGYKDNSRVADNFLIQTSPQIVYMIDFGEAEITRPLKDSGYPFSQLARLYASDYDPDDEEREDLFVINLTDVVADEGTITRPLHMTDAMRDASIRLLRSLSPLVGLRKSKRKQKNKSKRKQNRKKI